MVRIASLGFYFVSLLCILGVFHLVKYFAVKKLEAEKYDKRGRPSHSKYGILISINNDNAALE